jgi:hypothetical protein
MGYAAIFSAVAIVSSAAFVSLSKVPETQGADSPRSDDLCSPGRTVVVFLSGTHESTGDAIKAAAAAVSAADPPREILRSRNPGGSSPTSDAKPGGPHVSVSVPVPVSDPPAEPKSSSPSLAMVLAGEVVAALSGAATSTARSAGGFVVAALVSAAGMSPEAVALSATVTTALALAVAVAAIGRAREADRIRGVPVSEPEIPAGLPDMHSEIPRNRARGKNSSVPDW